jgi:hypothetical protein
MSDSVLIVLIVAAAVVVVLYLFRHQLRDFMLKASKQGLEASLSTHDPNKPEQAQPQTPRTVATPDTHKVVVRGNVQTGREHKIQVEHDDAEVRDNLQEGRDQEINVKPDPKGH